jgi:hypothetical protein
LKLAKFFQYAETLEGKYSRRIGSAGIMPTGRGLVAFKKPIELGKEDMYMIK